MGKDIIYRIEFEGAEEQLKNLANIQQKLRELSGDKTKLNDEIAIQIEKEKLSRQELLKQYRAEQTAIKDKQKEQKAMAGSLEQLRLQAKRLGKELETSYEVGSVEFKKAAGALEEINRKIRNADKSAGNFKSNIGNYAGSIGDAFQGLGVNVGSLTSSLGAATMATGPLGVGLAALVGGAQLFGNAIKTTDTLSDKFAETMGAVKEATNTFFRALAEDGGFKNFISNFREAIKEGRRYIATLDTIGDRQRAIQILESGDRERLAELQIIRRDVTKSIEERIKASAEIISIELRNAKMRKDLANDELDNELTNASKRTKLSKERIKELLILNETNQEVVQKAKEYNQAIDVLAKAASDNPLLNIFTDKTKARDAKITVESTSSDIRQLAAEYRKLGSISEESYEKIAEAFEKVGDENASFFERTARTQVALSKLKKGQIDDEEEYAEVIAKSSDAAIKSEQAKQDKIDKTNKEYYRQKKLLQEIQNILSVVSGVKPVMPIDQMAGETRPESFDAMAPRSGAGEPVIEELTFEQKKNLLQEQFDQNKITYEQFQQGMALIVQAQAEANQQMVNTAVSAAQQLVGVWLDVYQQREQALRTSLDRGLISEKQYQKESEKLQKRQANLQRTLAIVQLTADMARTLSALGLGAANTAKVGFPYNIPLLIAFAAQAAGIIANLKSIKLAEGGLIVGGKSHAAGGTKFIGSDGSHFEAEKGELLAVVNKHDTARIGALSAINSVHGKPFYKQPSLSYFAQGGMFTPNQSASTMTSDMIRQIVSQVVTIPVVLNTNKIEQANKQQRKVEVIGSL